MRVDRKTKPFDIKMFNVSELKAYDDSLKLALYLESNKLDHYNQTARQQTNDRQTNCPNCGAPITHNKCDYCGTRFMHKT